ncbi:MAG TPA: hypothetical protein VIX73_30670, partial [Kofleriaceae bacterium]
FATIAHAGRLAAVAHRGRLAACVPPSRLAGDQRLAPRRAVLQLLGHPAVEPLSVELDADARDLANVGDELTATRRDARSQVVEPPLRLIVIAPAGAIGRVGAYPVPERARQLARQTEASSFGERIESIIAGIAPRIPPGGERHETNLPHHSSRRR